MKSHMSRPSSIKEEPLETPLELSEENVEAVDRFINNTNWSEFWSRVIERTSDEVDAYEKARVKSLQTAVQHVFM